MTAYERLSNDESTAHDVSPSRSSMSNTMNSSTRLSIDSDTQTAHSPASSSSPPSSSANPSSATVVDLESQQRPRLTPAQRALRVFNHFVPIQQTYHRISNGIQHGRMERNVPGRFIGQGTDGVFQNLMAKPDTAAVLQQQQRELHPPTYEEASQDSSPEYWESTMISPMYEDEVFVQGLPMGNIANFAWNALVTIAFQFVGFILCYLLHTSHAAKQGSRFGLGVNLIMYGWNVMPVNTGNANEKPQKLIIDDANDFDIDKNAKFTGRVDNYVASGVFVQGANDAADDALGGGSYANAPYVAYGLIAFGLFVILKSCVDYYKIKQMEKQILNPSVSSAVETQTVTGQVENDEESSGSDHEEHHREHER
ncbi:uncharacterized protein LODBEIA_P35290 [Lodderomyces beijingensis]|uniref:Metal homeostatis protein BSD2 n=1 Tax=Lodderomyces beijingensis TaxID=1775926 RepID=A0ABP0ZQ20_9ASCO